MQPFSVGPRMAWLSQLLGALAMCALLSPVRGGFLRDESRLQLEVTDFHVLSTVVSRYALTTTRSVVLNPDSEPREAVFDVDLPATAFISNFTLTVNGKVYPAQVQEKLKAQRVYDTARSRGQTAAHLASRPRESDRFRVAVNVAARGRVEFALTYEELLQRRMGRYELAVGLRPRQVVRNLTLEAQIAEGSGIERLDVLPLRTNSLLNNQLRETSGAPPSTSVERTPTCARVTFSPTPEQQAAYSPQGILGEFVVQYDARMDNLIGDVQTQNGYFVHYFAPRNLPVMAKNIIFVIDVSSSMYGTKLSQTKDAMNTILRELRADDFFNIVTFSDVIEVWQLNRSIRASPPNVQRAREYVANMEATGWTDINGALSAAGELVGQTPPSAPAGALLPLVLFLTDGEPTSGVTSPEAIVRNAKASLGPGPTALFCLGFGDDADAHLLRRLAADNRGSFRPIYEDEDADLQLKGFYDEVSSPLLFDVRLEYPENAVGQTTGTLFPAFFNGSELVVAGVLKEGLDHGLRVRLRASGPSRDLDLEASVSLNGTGPPESCSQFPGLPAGFARRLWAYRTIQELLQARLTADEEVGRRLLTEQAVNLSLEHHFVTPVTSMVVVRPEDDEEVEARPTSPDPRPPTTAGRPLTSHSPPTTLPSPAGTSPPATLAAHRADRTDSDTMLRSGGILVQAKMDPAGHVVDTDYFYKDLDPHQGHVVDTDYFYEDLGPHQGHVVDTDYFYEDLDPHQDYFTAILPTAVDHSTQYLYSVDGDPHFVVKIPNSNESICFTIDGQAGDVVSLIEDPLSGVTAIGHLLGAPSSPEHQGHARNFFDWVSVKVPGTGAGSYEVNVSRDGLSLQGEHRLDVPWQPPSVTSKPGVLLEVSRSANATLRVGNAQEFLFVLHRYHHPSPLQRSHLGFYVVRADGLSPRARGLLGQFQQDDIHLQRLGVSEGSQGLAMLHRGGRSAIVRSVSKVLKDSALPAHPASCWAVSRSAVERVLRLSYTDHLLPQPLGA